MIYPIEASINIITKKKMGSFGSNVLEKKWRVLYLTTNLKFCLRRKDNETVYHIFNPGGFFDKAVIIDNSCRKRYSLFDDVVVLPYLGDRNPLSRPVDVIRGMKRIKNIAHEYDIDLIIQLFSLPYDARFALVWAVKETGIPYIMTIQNEYSKLFREERSFFSRLNIPQKLYEYNLKKAQGIRLNSKELINEVPVSYQDKTCYIPRKENIAYLKSIRKKNKQTDKRELTYLMVSRLRKQKNVIKAVLAFGQSLEKNKNKRLIIVGKGNLKEQIIDLIADKGFREHIELIDELGREEILQLFAVSDVFLFPSRYEGRPRVVFEAIVFRLPIICADIEPTRNMVVDQVNGLRVDPESIDEIKKAIEKMENDELRDKLSAGNEFYNIDEYSIENVNSMEIKFYSKIIEDKKIKCRMR